MSILKEVLLKCAQTNQVIFVMGFNFLTKLQVMGLQFYQTYASLQVFFKIFDQICSIVICKETFEILRISVSQKTF